MADGDLPGDPGEVIGANDDRIERLDIEDEMRSSYLTYAMSVIISRALPDVRDGLKPSQRRILVAMNDLNLGPSGGRKKCAKIAGDTSGNYHPHGETGVYPTLVRMAQNWVMREVLVDKQGNFGSLAGLPPAAMRYTEARLSAASAEMLRDLNRDTVDFIPTYDNSAFEPVVLPSRFPNLVVNGSTGIAVGMATSIPPHNLAEVCDAVGALLEDPDISMDGLLEYLPAPDFPTGGVICGRAGIRQGYLTGRSTITLRARTHFETERNSDVIVITEIPYLETRDRIRERLEQIVKDGRVDGISRVTDLTDRTCPSWQVRLHVTLKRDADKEIVLNQLFKYSPLQSTVSIILLALVGNRPQTLTIKQLLQEFVRHRITVIRRRTEFLLAEARKRKHTVEGLLIAQVDIDQVIQTIRDSASRAQAKERLQEIQVPSELVERALGEGGFKHFVNEKGPAENYSLSSKQAEAIVSMQLGSLASLEREELSGEFNKLLEEIDEYLRLLSDEANIREVIRQDMQEIKDKFGNKRRTEISDEELGDVDRGDLIAEEPMVVTISQRGYVKRTALSTYQAQGRGGKGIKGAKSDDEDPLEHLFIASTHDFLLFFTDRGKVYWRKVYDLPQQARTAKGRALVNLLEVSDENEHVATCFPVREFPDDLFLLMATRSGTVKKTALSAYSRPLKGGIIAIKLDDGDELIDVKIVGGDDDVVLATRDGMAIRFSHHDARSMGRNTRGVRGIGLVKGDAVVGLVRADTESELLTVCEHGYGKRTPFGNASVAETSDADDSEDSSADISSDDLDDSGTDAGGTDNSGADGGSDEATPTSSGMRYRRQKRGGKGLRDIKTTDRNGKVVDVVATSPDDEILMITATGKIQRIRAADVRRVGRNSQGVRVIRLSDGDRLVSLARIPFEIAGEEEDDDAEELDNPTLTETPEANLPPETVSPESDDSSPPETGEDSENSDEEA
ncbi:DNA gyrase subunit A [Stratiformator vulcanicus]|uniref:DNA topoisomerase (ATP-hydrolyzing) n=1 Tax=Stratiformator vulcanicus TaxID=2527980 RepID=A0A517R2F8_9PLAN|nr:DNA gyrase subunit A [Stratiformator vulcanicus]QDT38048.1 DNA gyrase subunit A [Stratiformator vulcanicus]